MKLFISADIEGTAGIVSFEEADPETKYYPYFAREMTQEVRSACEGAGEAGVRDILIKDGHHAGRNLDPSGLPENIRILRGWTRNPYSMMGGLDSGFSAAAMVGYHASCASNGNPLAHTEDLQNEIITLNGEIMSEFMMNAYTAAYLGVPTVFVSGDRCLCESAKKLIPGITAVPVSEGIGNASISIHPAAAQKAIREGMTRALGEDLSRCLLSLPDRFETVIRFREASRAYRASFYPGAKADGMKGVTFASGDYMDVLKFFMFVL